MRMIEKVIYKLQKQSYTMLISLFVISMLFFLVLYYALSIISLTGFLVGIAIMVVQISAMFIHQKVQFKKSHLDKPFDHYELACFVVFYGVFNEAIEHGFVVSLLFAVSFFSTCIFLFAFMNKNVELSQKNAEVML